MLSELQTNFNNFDAAAAAALELSLILANLI